MYFITPILVCRLFYALAHTYALESEEHLKALQSNLYISIALGPSGAMLLRGYAFICAIIAIVPNSGQQGQC